MGEKYRACKGDTRSLDYNLTHLLTLSALPGRRFLECGL